MFRPHCLKSAIFQLKEQTGKEAIFLELDLSGLEKVTKAANEFKRYAAMTSYACGGVGR